MNVFTQFIRSLHSPKHIAMFRFQGIGKTILYIFVLMLITLIPSGIVFGTNFSQMFHHFDEALGENSPNFKITNGILEADFDNPYIAGVNDYYFIIDPKNELDRIDIAKQYESAIVLTERDALFINHTDIQEIRYRNFGNINFTKDELHSFVKSLLDLLPILIPILLVFIYLLVTGLKFVGVSVLAIIGFALIKFVKPNNINYRHLWIMSAYAVTLPTTIFNVVNAFNIHLPASFGIYWIIATAMLYTALNSIPKRKTTE
ncbi:MAG TPA: DUF1189 domain-containing protein [Bacilli bacterium]|nr:DUF1189 domain-containing protein [Bacilli bacterium]